MTYLASDTVAEQNNWLAAGGYVSQLVPGWALCWLAVSVNSYTEQWGRLGSQKNATGTDAIRASYQNNPQRIREAKLTD